MFARSVFYLAGFDPRGARFYHQLLADQVRAAQARGTLDPAVAVSPRRRDGGDVAWDVTDGATAGASAGDAAAPGPGAPDAGAPHAGAPDTDDGVAKPGAGLAKARATSADIGPDNALAGPHPPPAGPAFPAASISLPHAGADVADAGARLPNAGAGFPDPGPGAPPASPGLPHAAPASDADAAALPPPTFAATHRFLAWDDIVRANWPKGPLAVARGTLGAYRGFLAHLDRRLAMQWPWGSRFTLFYPGATMAGVPLVVALVVAGLLTLLADLALPHLPRAAALWGTVAATLAITAGATAVLLHRMHSMWLLRFVIFNHLLAEQRATGDLDARLDRFADTIAAAIRTAPADEEVLLVTHSNGSILAMPLMARLLDRFDNAMPANFALVTLGCCIPLLAAHRGAGWFHATLDRVATGAFRWLDIGSPTDGACAPLIAPCQGRAIERPAGLTQVSPRWFRYADPATYKARRADKYNTHFDYLRRMETPSPLDYLSLTCSAQPLATCIAAFAAENG